MKSYVVALITLVSMALTAGAAGKMKVPRLKTVGIMKNKVIAQTAPEYMEKMGRTTVLRRFYIARWGVHRYEYGYVKYHCLNQKCELDENAVRLKFYESCKGFKRNGQPNCTRLVSERVDFTNSEVEEINRDRTWYSCEDYNVSCGRNPNDRYDDYTGDRDTRNDDNTIWPWGP